MTKLHTPGPWGWSFLDREVQSVSGPVCKVLTPMQSWTNADALLIAAAPEMLTALRKAYRMLVSRNSHPVISDNLAAAIHLASGHMHCDTCRSTGYVGHDNGEYGPCEDCFDGREIAEEEARNA